MSLYHFSKIFRYLVIIFIAGACFGSKPQKSFAQLQVAPTALYLDDDNRTGRIAIRNTSADPVEVEVELLFGYPDINEDGKVYLKLYDSIPDHLPSALEWVRAYPRNIVLKGGERQVVRFAARPPEGLTNGEYWLRPAIVSYLPDMQAGGNLSSSISARLKIRKRNILALSYRKGPVRTGVGITSLTTRVQEERLRVLAEFQRKGNAAYIGHYKISLTDSGGRQVYSEKKQIALYRDQKRIFDIDKSDLMPGTYTVEIELSTKDRTNGGILQAPEAIASSVFTIQ